MELLSGVIKSLEYKFKLPNKEAIKVNHQLFQNTSRNTGAAHKFKGTSDAYNFNIGTDNQISICSKEANYRTRLDLNLTPWVGGDVCKCGP